MREEVIVTSNEIVTLEELPAGSPEAIEGSYFTANFFCNMYDMAILTSTVD
jgi:hypothetical protein